MHKNIILAFLLSSAFFFAACGDDDSPSSPENDQEEISSSSEYAAESSSSKTDQKEVSSSSENDEVSSSSRKRDKKSSSSVKAPESSFSEATLPEGARVAKLDDLEKNHELKLFDQTVYLSTGSKQGLIALRIPDELWLVTYTDLADGVVSFDEENSGMQYAETDAAKKIVGELKTGFKISFIVDKDGVLRYALNGSDYYEAIKASVAVQKDKVSKAADIKDKIYECVDGDTTRTFRFFDNSYIVETHADGKRAYWMGGHYDIQRSTLLMLPAYFSPPVYSMYTYSVGTDNSITLTDGTAMGCNVEDFEYDYEVPSDYIGDWQAEKDGIDWEFVLRADGSYKITAFEGTKQVEAKQGVWEIYGCYMVMFNKACMRPDNCTTSIYGQMQAGTVDHETGKISGFSFIHSDTGSPKIPTSFDAPEYE